MLNRRSKSSSADGEGQSGVGWLIPDLIADAISGALRILPDTG